MSLYAVVVGDVSVLREIKLESILNNINIDSEDYIHRGDFIYILSKENNRINLQSKQYMSWGRTYKTLNGAKKFYNEVKNLPSSNYSGKEFDIKKHKIIIAEIGESWNKAIDYLVSREVERHLQEIERLKKKYVK